MHVEGTQVNAPLQAESPRPGSQLTASRPTDRAPVHAAQISSESVLGSSRSRLVYDRELSRIFVEIVDSESGEVVHRFPPEELVRHIDSLIKQNEASGRAGAAGLVFDQTI